MKVRELIELLKKMPLNADIIISVDETETDPDVRIFSQPQGVQKNNEISVSILCYD